MKFGSTVAKLHIFNEITKLFPEKSSFISSETVDASVAVLAIGDGILIAAKHIEDVVVAIKLGVEAAYQLPHVEMDGEQGVGGEVLILRIGYLEGSVVGRIVLGELPDFIVSHIALADAGSLCVPMEVLGIVDDLDFRVFSVVDDYGMIVRQVFLLMRRDGYDAMEITGIVALRDKVTVPRTVMVDSETTALVDVKGLVGLVLDFDEIHAVFHVVDNCILYPPLDDVHLDVVGRHDGIFLHAKHCGITYPHASRAWGKGFVIIAVVSLDDLLVVFVRT